MRINTPNPGIICFPNLPTIPPSMAIAPTPIPRFIILLPNSRISPGIAWFAYSKLFAKMAILPAISTNLKRLLALLPILLDRATNVLIPRTTPPISPIFAANPPKSSGIESYANLSAYPRAAIAPAIRTRLMIPDLMVIIIFCPLVI